MANVDTFIPEVWSASVLSILAKNLVYGSGAVVNRDYEGDIAAYGDTVHIPTVADVSIVDYTKNSTTLNVEKLTTDEKLLVINQAKAFAFEIDDVDARQVRASGALFAEAAMRAGFGLRDAADQYLAGQMKSALTQFVASAGVASSPLALTNNTDVYDNVLVPASQKLDEANVPSEGRWIVVPPSVYSKLLLDTRFIKANESGTSALHTAYVGDAAGFVIMKSNNVPNASASAGKTLIAGTRIATSYAEQISKVEAFRPQGSFADALKGLHLYGAKVVRPEALVGAYVTV